MQHCNGLHGRLLILRLTALLLSLRVVQVLMDGRIWII